MSIVSAAIHVEVNITAAVESDRNFIWNSWTQSYRDSPHAKRFSEQQYFSLMQPRIEAILKRSQVLVARPADWDQGIIAWACTEPKANIIHYCYCKTLWRKQGVITQLISATFGAPIPTLHFSHFTMPSRKWIPDSWVHKKLYPT